MSEQVDKKFVIKAEEKEDYTPAELQRVRRLLERVRDGIQVRRGM